MAVTLTPVEGFKLGIIGLGNEGCRLVAALNLDPKWEVAVALWDSCAASLERIQADDSLKRNMGISIAHGLGCVGQYELGRSIYLDEQDTCRSWLQDKDLVLVAGALGGGFSGGFLPELARLAQQANTPMLAYGLLPFSFEGRRRVDGARQVLAQLRELCMAAVGLEGDDFLGEMQSDGLAHPVLASMFVEAKVALESMAAMLCEEGLYAFDLSTLQSAFDLDVAKSILFSAQCEDEVEGVDSALETLLERLEQKLPGKEMKVDRLLVHVTGGDRLAARAVNQINRVLTERFEQAGKTFFGACVREGMAGLRIVLYLSVHLGKQFEWTQLARTEETATQAVHRQSRKSKSRKSKSGSVGSRSSDNAEPVPQVMFDSILNESNRGYFDDTPANSWNGIDLDVPTYIRRGIRVKV